MARMEENALDAQDVAGMLHVSRNTVYNLAKAGDLSFYMVGRKMRFTLADVDAYISSNRAQGKVRATGSAFDDPAWDQRAFCVAGTDRLADFVSNWIGRSQASIQRSYINGYSSLEQMYLGSVDACVIHLFDQKTNRFNTPFVQRLVPGVPLVVFHLARREAGFLVQKKNPKRILKWRDLLRDDVTVAIRERGASERILFDEQLVSLGSHRSTFGRGIEARSTLSTAEFVAQGRAHVAIGNEQIANAVGKLAFLPQLEEDLAFVVAKRNETEDTIQALRTLLPSEQFKSEAAHLGRLDLARCGNIVYEI